MEFVDYKNFEELDIRVGEIIKAEDFENAKKPAYKLWIDFGELGIKKSSAQITKYYKLDELINKQIIAIINFRPKQIADFMSECLVLGIYDSNKNVVLLKPDKNVENGNKIG
jgi:tRNA-binding protein